MNLKYAIIGCGRISINHIKAALDNDVDIVCICDILKEKMDYILEKYELSDKVKMYTDYHEMIQKEKLDLVAIATESGKHGRIALDCIDKGINIIIEKPITLSIEEADLIIKNSREKGVKVTVCHQNRFNKSIQKVRKSIENNNLGKLIYGTASIRWNRGKEYYKQASWRGTYEQDGGALMNQCIHDIDLLRWMMGSEIEQVSGFTDNIIHDYIDAEDLGMALIKFKNGSYGIIEGTTDIYPENLEETLCIFGERGTIKVGGKSVNLIEYWNIENDNESNASIKECCNENPCNIYGFGHKRLYKDMIDAVKEDRKPYITAEDGRDALELVLAIYKSSSEKKNVRLPLKNCKTIDFKGSLD